MDGSFFLFSFPFSSFFFVFFFFVCFDNFKRLGRGLNIIE